MRVAAFEKAKIQEEESRRTELRRMLQMEGGLVDVEATIKYVIVI